MQPFDSRLVSLRDWLPGQMLTGTGGVRYYLRERVGEGGQGWVFTASWDDPAGYVVIVKVLRPDAITPESFGRFEREAQVLRMLGQAARPNPHVVRFFDHATARLSPPSGGAPIELPFTVLEYVRGPTLEHILDRTRGVGLALDRFRRIARQIALALEDVHAHKIVHRDLKPSNVLLATEGGSEVAKVTDFGLVKVVDVGLGRTTALAGATLGYAPPEQFERGNRRVSQRTDVFSFAAMLFEMLTGVKAFPHGDGENPLVVVTRLLNGPRPSLRTTRGVLPREIATRPELLERLDALLLRATAAEPGERQASISELWTAVEGLLGMPSQRPSPPAGLVATAVDHPKPQIASPAVAPAGRSVRESADVTTPHPDSLPETEYARPAAWSWRVRTPTLAAGAVVAALFDPTGESAGALTGGGLSLWQGSSWTRVRSASDGALSTVRGLAWLRPGELVVFGERGLAARVVPGAAPERWPVPDGDVTFLGAHVDAPGMTVTLVGERPARRALRGGAHSTTMGAIAQFARGKLVLLSDAPACARLRGVTRLRTGEIVACGDWGSLVRLELGVAEHVGSICGGHLSAIASLRDGAITVGAGGHALSLTARLQAQLEAVQTTRDLAALTVDAQGVAWAGSAQARILRRSAGSWVRMSAELGLSSSVVALWASGRTLRAICDDGAVIEGMVRDDHVDR